MTREEEFKKVKELIIERYEYADCGLYNVQNMVGDIMTTLFKGQYFKLDICYGWNYYEVFGTTNEEFEELMYIYNEQKYQKN